MERGRNRRQPEVRNWESRTERKKRQCPREATVSLGPTTLWAMLMQAHSPWLILWDKMREKNMWGTEIRVVTTIGQNHHVKHTSSFCLPISLLKSPRLRGVTYVNGNQFDSIFNITRHKCCVCIFELLLKILYQIVSKSVNYVTSAFYFLTQKSMAN